MTMTTKRGITKAIIRVLWYYTVGMRKRKRVVVFGIFDGVHGGHRDLLRQAKEHGNELIVIVGRGSASLQWKGVKPKHSERERLSFVQKEQYVDRAVLGDEEQSTYKILEELNPDIICLGYDQEALGRDLKKWMLNTKKRSPVIRLKSFKPDICHNSLFA
jgi:FAD synthetase